MHCHELQETMKRFIDGEVDGETRKLVGLHLADCEQCLNLINGNRFWEDAVISLFDREAPSGLRTDILGDLAAHNPAAPRPLMSSLGWRKKMKIIGWATTRETDIWSLLRTAAITIAVIILVQVIIHFLP